MVVLILGVFQENTRVRYLYSFLLYLILPFLFIRLWWKSRRLPAYRERMGERLGFYPFRLEKCIWVHAVSVGEAIAAAPLIKSIVSRYPTMRVLVTTMTPTGARQVQTSFGDSVTHAYIPYDFPDAVARFLKTMHPVISIIMETELWPNMVAACQKNTIPVCLINARLSEKSALGYERVAPLTREILKNIQVIAAHGDKDAARFIALGAAKERVQVTGSLKFDLTIAGDLPAQCEALREQLGKDRFVWIAASTHEGEEEIILAAHQLIRANHPHALLILVPRHPERFDAIATMCAHSFSTSRRSQKQPCLPETAVYLGDTMGELMLMYGAADVAFVGGSLIPKGGHNMLEPGALGKPIVSGPHLFNFKEISELFMQANAMILVDDAATLVKRIESLMQNKTESAEMGKRARAVVDANRGALVKQLEIINNVMVLAARLG